MSITDHKAILLQGSLDQARPSKAKPGKVEFYARVALPPQAAADLTEACKSVAPNGSLSGLHLAPKLHSSLPADKQFPGVPADWFILRLASGASYPPDLYLTSGEKVEALPINGKAIMSDFYSGQFVRINTYPFHYPPTNGGSAGVAFNLTGIMAVGGGDRRPGGNSGESSESAFAKYRDDSAPAQTAPQATSQHAATGAATNDNPFAQGSAGGGGANPFA